MKSTLERFQIIGLHGRAPVIDIHIRENTLVLVGENGSGKTTFLRILFNFLSGRWIFLAQFVFESVIATIAGNEYKVTHEELVKAFKGVDRRLLFEYSRTMRRKQLEIFQKDDIERFSLETAWADARFPGTRETMLRQIDLIESKPRGLKKQFQETITIIQGAINAQILYLPTYRRIERELSSIFEGVDPEDLRRQKRSVRQQESGHSYIELVEFGMKDVQQAVNNTLDRLKEFARENLNNLTLGYLGDVVDQEYKKVGMNEIAGVSDDTVSAVLDRIQDSILTKDHKRHLSTVINSARSADAPTEHEQIIYHYLLKLLRFQQSLQDKEKHISAFCDLCSEYILDKKFVYDSPTFSFSIVPTDRRHSERSIELSDLSSGEKQIVSLFSHLYLSGQQQFFVLIDEPELSLSVPWQRRFLADIHAGQFCAGLVAVTHSPFIYDNSLRSYTHALGEFVSI